MTQASTLPEGATLLADGKVRYELRYPIKYKMGNADQELKEIIVRRKNFADNKAIKALNNEVDIGFTLFCRLTGVDEPIADQLDDIDQIAFGQIVESFTTSGPKTRTSAQAS